MSLCKRLFLQSSKISNCKINGATALKAIETHGGVRDLLDIDNVY